MRRVLPEPMRRVGVALALTAAAASACTAQREPGPVLRTEPAPAGPAATPPAASTPATRAARVVLAGGDEPETWVDIAVNGDPGRALALCTYAVAQELRARTVNPDVHIARECSAQPLQPVRARAGSVLLVHATPLDADADFLVNALEGSVADNAASATGRVTGFTRHPDAASCKRALAKVRDAHLEEERRARADVLEFLQQQLATARAEEARECAAPVDACEPGRDGELCQLVRAKAERECTFQRGLVTMLESRVRAPGTSARAAELRCVPE